MPNRESVHRRFTEVCQAAELNLATAIDLVLVHNEQDARRRRPRSSLNEATIVLALGSWERFIADTEAAFRDDEWRPESVQSLVSKSYSAKADRTLAEVGACRSGWNGWEVRSFGGWRGNRLTSPQNLNGDQVGTGGLTMCQHLDQWVELRNGIVHHQRSEVYRLALDEQLWKDRYKSQKRSDPYLMESGGRWVIWRSAATSLGIQSGPARACLAFVVQLLDNAMMSICETNDWNPWSARLPAEWFSQSLPDRFRTVNVADLHCKTLWGDGVALIRRGEDE